MCILFLIKIENIYIYFYFNIHFFIILFFVHYFSVCFLIKMGYINYTFLLFHYLY